MKKILATVVFVLFFIGCTQKEQVVEVSTPEVIVKEVVKDEKKEDKIIVEAIEDNSIKEESLMNIDNKEKFDIAFIFSSKMVSKYANSSIDTIIAYLNLKKIDFNLNIIDIEDESLESIQKAIDEIKQFNTSNVIALLTPLSTNNFEYLNTENLQIYLPLIEKNEELSKYKNFIFGSISYEKQIDEILNYLNIENHNFSMFYQDSFLGKKLKTILEEKNINFLVQKDIKRKGNNFKELVFDERLNNTVLFLNTDVVNTALLLSQLYIYEITPKIIFSTQLNYDSKLLALTQESDRANFFVLNSINSVDEKLKDEVELFGGNIIYEWVDYSTLIGIDYLFDKENRVLSNISIEDNQVVYMPKLYSVTEYGFLEIK